MNIYELLPSLVQKFPRQSCWVGAWLCLLGPPGGAGAVRNTVLGASSLEPPDRDLTLRSSSQPAATPYPCAVTPYPCAVTPYPYARLSARPTSPHQLHPQPEARLGPRGSTRRTQAPF